MDYFVANSFVAPAHTRIQNKAGAVPVKNGQRRVPRSIFSSEEESGEDELLEKQGRGNPESENTTVVPEPNKQIEIREEGDSLLRRLMRFNQQGHNDDDDDQSRRQIQEFEVSDAEENSLDSSESSSDNSSEESSEYEESTDSEEEMVPRLKPVFKPKRERITVTEKEEGAQKAKQMINEAQKLVEQYMVSMKKVMGLKQQGHNNDDDDKSRKRQIREFDVSDAEENSENLFKSNKRIKLDSSESSDEEDLSDENIERKREILKQGIPLRVEEEEVLTDDEETKSDNSSEESSEYEESTDSEEERQAEIETQKLVEERKRRTLRWVEESTRYETEVRSSIYEKEGNFNNGNTEDQNDELEYEPWNMREFKT